MMRMKSEKRSVEEVLKACEELAAMGLIQDSGRRRNGQIVWVITPLGRLWPELLDESSKQ
jgi:hypothetical protein